MGWEYRKTINKSRGIIAAKNGVLRHFSKARGKLFCVSGFAIPQVRSKTISDFEGPFADLVETISQPLPFLWTLASCLGLAVAYLLGWKYPYIPGGGLGWSTEIGADWRGRGAPEEIGAC
jgi:hypothetical protein